MCRKGERKFMKYTAPSFRVNAFNCPKCGAYAHMLWTRLFAMPREVTEYWMAKCTHCPESSLWRQYGDHSSDDGEMLYPDNGNTELPSEDMPEDGVSTNNGGTHVMNIIL